MQRHFKIGRKNIGTFDFDSKKLHKDVKKSAHLFRALDAWGIDNATLEKLPADAVIEIDDFEEQMRYTCTVQDYIDKGQFYHFKNQDADHKVQRFLARKNFTQKTLKRGYTEDELAELAYCKNNHIPIPAHLK